MNGDSTKWSLVVDDEPAIRDITAFALSRYGFRCDTAPDGHSALERVQERSYDLIVTDLHMPRMHGHEFVKNLKQIGSDAVLIVVTSISEPKLMLELFNLGVDDFILKPVSPDLLAVKAVALLAKRDKTQTSQAPLEQAPERSAVVAQKLTQTTEELRSQLKQIEADFLGTIKSLEKQKETLEAKCVGSVRALSQLMDQFEHPGGCHASRVEDMAVALKEIAKLDELEVHELMLGALLHDIGQFGLPDEVKVKALADIDSEEHRTFSRYPIIGATVVSQIADSSRISQMVLRHRENYDGTGFPDRFEGDSIPIGARVIRIADVLDMELMRSGDDEDKVEFASQVLKSWRGSWFDPRLVDAALRRTSDFIRPHLKEEVKEIEMRSLRPGHVLAENLRDRAGRLILSKGSTITEGMIPHLQRVRLPSEIVKIRGQ